MFAGSRQRLLDLQFIEFYHYKSMKDRDDVSEKDNGKQ